MARVTRIAEYGGDVTLKAGDNVVNRTPGGGFSYTIFAGTEADPTRYIRSDLSLGEAQFILDAFKLWAGKYDNGNIDGFANLVNLERGDWKRQALTLLKEAGYQTMGTEGPAVWAGPSARGPRRTFTTMRGVVDFITGRSN